MTDFVASVKLIQNQLHLFPGSVGFALGLKLVLCRTHPDLKTFLTE